MSECDWWTHLYMVSLANLTNSKYSVRCWNLRPLLVARIKKYPSRFKAGLPSHPCWSVLKIEMETCVEYTVVSLLSYKE
jgi:hypothetical protein